MLSNCGFQPIVEKNLKSPRFQQYIKIDQPKDRNEFIVREHLFRLLDPPIEEKYLLSFSTNISSNTGIVTKENQTTIKNQKCARVMRGKGAGAPHG